MIHLMTKLLFIITLCITFISCKENIDYEAEDKKYVEEGKAEMSRLVSEYIETIEGQQFIALYEIVGELVDSSRYDQLNLVDTVTTPIRFETTDQGNQNALMVYQDFHDVPIEYDYKKTYFSRELDFRKAGESLTNGEVACNTYEPVEFKMEWDYQLQDIKEVQNCQYLFILREMGHKEMQVLSESKYVGGVFIGELYVYSISNKKLLNVLPINAANSEILAYTSNGDDDNFREMAHGDMLNKINATIQMQLELNFNISSNLPYVTYDVFGFKARQY